MKKAIWLSIYFLLLFLISCSESNNKLPILGNRTPHDTLLNGKKYTDTIYSVIPAFHFTNQDGKPVTEETLKGKITVADFFFISCPTICPVMKREMIRVYGAYKGDPGVLLISHTIDPEHDTLSLLKDYCSRIGSDGKQWMFLTGEREKIYEMAENGYYATAMPDSTAPGGFAHSGGFILVDPKLRVRGIYEGTSPEDVDRLIKDIAILKAEKE